LGGRLESSADHLRVKTFDDLLENWGDYREFSEEVTCSITTMDLSIYNAF
jgi:hypothetical protein